MTAYSFKRRFVDPIRVGLGLQISAWAFASGMDEFGNVSKPPPKRQTIRADRKRHARPDEDLQLYCGMRTKDCFLIGRARCVDVQRIAITFNPVHPIILIGGSPYRKPLQAFAQADGFASFKEMRQFWEQEHPGIDDFNGVIITWEPLP